jgi:alpha-galactosidase
MIGAGSGSFGLSCIRDAFATPGLFGSELVFVDLDATALARVLRAAERMNRETGADYRLSGTTDRLEALRGADFVILAVAVRRMEMWKLDLDVPLKHGVQHVLGENGGPAAIFHTMRNIPPILAICRDMERLCPDALLVNFTNPEGRICRAVQRYSRIRVVGLCHQIGRGYQFVSRVLGRPVGEFEIKAMGLNHFTWIRDLRDRATGEDLVPEFTRRMETHDPTDEPLSQYLYRAFGWMPTPGDGHLGEYVPYAHEFMSKRGPDFAGSAAWRGGNLQKLADLGDPTIPVPDELRKPSGEHALAVCEGVSRNTHLWLDSANLRNDGLIENLPDDAIVEVPAVVSSLGVTGVRMGRLPEGIAGMCAVQAQIQKLNVEAGAEGDRAKLFQAMLLEPVVNSAVRSRAIVDELLALEKDLLPQFHA